MWEALWCETEMTAKDQQQEVSDALFTELIQEKIREVTSSQNLQRRLWNQEAKMQQGLMAVNEKLNKSVQK